MDTPIARAESKDEQIDRLIKLLRVLTDQLEHMSSDNSKLLEMNRRLAADVEFLNKNVCDLWLRVNSFQDIVSPARYSGRLN